MTTIIRTSAIFALILGFASALQAGFLPPIQVTQWTLGVASRDLQIGTQITRVANGSPAQKVGLRRGDVILAVSGTQVGWVNGQQLPLETVLNAQVGNRGWVTLSVQDGRTGQVGVVPVQLAPTNVGVQPPFQPGLPPRADRQIRGWYLSYLGRIPRPDEVQVWLNLVAQGATLVDVHVAILASAEYYQRYNNNPILFAQSIYEPILGRQITQNELAILVQRLTITFQGDRIRFVQTALSGN